MAQQPPIVDAETVPTILITAAALLLWVTGVHLGIGGHWTAMFVCAAATVTLSLWAVHRWCRPDPGGSQVPEWVTTPPPPPDSHDR